jgi:hypothetical protein
MPPALRSFPRTVVERVFIEFGIHLLEEFPDGQTRWGNQPMTKPYKGKSVMAQRSRGFGVPADSYDIFSIRNIIDRIDLGAKTKEIEKRIEQLAVEESEKE